MSHGQARATYLHAGVDEQREQKTLREIMLPWFEKTRRSSVAHSVLGVGAGHFATVVKFAAGNSIALSTDGVGTKILVARMADRYEPIGVDCVANNVNDLICIGARPLILLDYIAIDRIDENVLERIARGLSEGAQEAQVEIAGGEIAQVAGLLASSEDGPPMFDLVGTALGEIEGNPPRALDGSMVRLGDVVIGLPSSGLHSNGYSLARYALFEKADLALDYRLPETRQTLADALLEPTKIYVRPVQALWDANIPVHGLVNISGGGLLNLTRLSAEVSYILDSLPDEAPVFRLIREKGELSWAEMFATFNMGVGLCIVVPESSVESSLNVLEDAGESPFILGSVVQGNERSVQIPKWNLTGSGDEFFPMA
jgi:phosphoribosylformylglycinamidine cyclo-ligase